MKKIFALIAILLTGLTLVACAKDEVKPAVKPTPDEDTENLDLKAVEAALDKLTVATSVTDNFTLPTVGAGSVTVSWESDNAAIALTGGNATVTRPENEAGDTTVKLTATATKGDESKAKDFTVTVVKKDAVADIERTDISEVLLGESNVSYTLVGVVSYVNINSTGGVTGFTLTDETGTIYVYGTAEVAIGNEIKLEATYTLNTFITTVPDGYEDTDYKGSPQMISPVVTLLNESKDIPAYTPVDTTMKPNDIKYSVLSDNIAGNVYRVPAYMNKSVSTYTSYYFNDYNGTKAGFQAYSQTGNSGSPELAMFDEHDQSDVYVTVYVLAFHKTKGYWTTIVLDVEENNDGIEGGGDSGTTTPPTPAGVTPIEDARKLADGAEVTIQGAIVSISLTADRDTGEDVVYNYHVADATGVMYIHTFYSAELVDVVKVGQFVTVTGKVGSYNEGKQVIASDVASVVIDDTKGTNNTYSSPVTETTLAALTAVESKDAKFGQIFKITATYGKGEYATLTSGDASISVIKNTLNSKYDALDGKTCTVVIVLDQYYAPKSAYNVTILSMVASDGSTGGDTDTTTAQTELDKVANPFSTEVYLEGTTVTLVASTDSTVTLSYETSDAAVIAISGNTATITLPTEGQASVTITVTATCNGKTVSKTFTVLVGEVGEMTIANVKEAAVGTKATIVGTVVYLPESASDSHFIITDGTANIVVDFYDNSLVTKPAVGDVVSVTGETVDYFISGTLGKGGFAFSKVTAFTTSTEAATTEPAAVEVDFNDFADDTAIVTWLGTLEASDMGTKYILKNVKFETTGAGVDSTTGYSYFCKGDVQGGLYKTAFKVYTTATSSFSCYLIGANKVLTETGRIMRFTGVTAYTA